MKEATFSQAFQVLKFFNDQELTCEQVQTVFSSGLLADISEAVKTDKEISRDEVRKALGLESPMLEFETWKTIELGTGLRTADEFRRALKDGGFRISNRADDILGKPAFTAATEETELDLVKVSGAELGFKKGATRRDIYNRAQEVGLGLCPNEVGPQLRLQYKDQPRGEWLLVAMEPMAVSDGDLDVFDVERVYSGLWLGGHYGGPEGFWRGDDCWLFVRPASNGA